MLWRPTSIVLVRVVRVLAGCLLLLGASGAGVAHAIDVKVRVTIERVRALTDFEGGGEADFYAVVTIDGQEFENKDDAIDDDDDISPNWEFSRSVDVARGSIPVVIRIFDEDGIFRLDDDEADLIEGPARGLGLTVTLAPCNVRLTDPDQTVSGPGIVFDGPEGSCGTRIFAGGFGADSAAIEFRIVVEEPPSAPGLRVDCLHSPIWPQPTDMVTITANARDGALAPRVADNIEIWVNDRTAPARSAGGVTLAHTVGPFPAGSFSYGCRVVDDGVPVFTGWRVVSVGSPALGRAVPVLFTGPLASRIDLVFIPDSASYPAGATDATFLADVRNVIQAYYSEDIYLTNQDKVNFWVAQDTGTARNDCSSETPDNWDDDYTFAETGAVMHRDGTIRDCAPGGEQFFSGDATRLDGGRLGRVFLHETGHRPFGLADEYCCDGGYYQSEPFPNVYSEPEDCADDAPGLGRTAAACREFEEDGFWFFDSDWSVSDPATNDLMVDNLTAQGADARRMNWMFGQCAAAGC
jgi:hypothetical protein